MTIRIGDRLVIKREGKILTPDAGEAYHEFEVLKQPSLVTLPEKVDKILYELIVEMLK